ncbi:hypothetical protein [Ralstonia pseudosolanacearum]|uniref:hypothetical protein n=1 Tax=Ralstonia pseudosolanacearum TaxID=1310165 RepID=UPI001FF806AE|nr:hypothetical protein [Ralstonia pseudosolanacearum]
MDAKQAGKPKPCLRRSKANVDGKPDCYRALIFKRSNSDIRGDELISNLEAAPCFLGKTPILFVAEEHTESAKSGARVHLYLSDSGQIEESFYLLRIDKELTLDNSMRQSHVVSSTRAQHGQ